MIWNLSDPFFSGPVMEWLVYFPFALGFWDVLAKAGGGILSSLGGFLSSPGGGAVGAQGIQSLTGLLGGALERPPEERFVFRGSGGYEDNRLDELMARFISDRGREQYQRALDYAAPKRRINYQIPLVAGPGIRSQTATGYLPWSGRSAQFGGVSLNTLGQQRPGPTGPITPPPPPPPTPPPNGDNDGELTLEQRTQMGHAQTNRKSQEHIYNTLDSVNRMLGEGNGWDI